MRIISREFGSRNRRHLTLMAFFPSGWNSVITPWEFGFGRWLHGSHRCHCDRGRFSDGRITVFGFSLCWWYSHYFGEVPCVCDRMRDS